MLLNSEKFWKLALFSSLKLKYLGSGVSKLHFLRGKNVRHEISYKLHVLVLLGKIGYPKLNEHFWKKFRKNAIFSTQIRLGESKNLNFGPILIVHLNLWTKTYRLKIIHTWSKQFLYWFQAILENLFKKVTFFSKSTRGCEKVFYYFFLSKKTLFLTS